MSKTARWFRTYGTLESSGGRGYTAENWGEHLVRIKVEDAQLFINHKVVQN